MDGISRLGRHRRQYSSSLVDPLFCMNTLMTVKIIGARPQVQVPQGECVERVVVRSVGRVSDIFESGAAWGAVTRLDSTWTPTSDFLFSPPITTSPVKKEERGENMRMAPLLHLLSSQTNMWSMWFLFTVYKGLEAGRNLRHVKEEAEDGVRFSSEIYSEPDLSTIDPSLT